MAFVVSRLSYVVEVSVWNFLLSGQLLHLIQEDVHLEFRAQVLQAAVAERLPVKHHTEETQAHISCKIYTEHLNSDICRLMVSKKHSHWAIDNEGHHNIHVSDVLRQVRIGQVQFCASEKQNSIKVIQTDSLFFVFNYYFSYPAGTNTYLSMLVSVA